MVWLRLVLEIATLFNLLRKGKVLMSVKHFVVAASLGLALTLVALWGLDVPTILARTDVPDESGLLQANLTAPNSVANGDFESGRDGSWEEMSLNGLDIITTSLAVPDHSGFWAAWLGGSFSELSVISQSVMVPVDATTLSYWHWIASEDVCGYYYDYGEVWIDDTLVQTVELCDDAGTEEWVERFVSLTSYAGQTVTLQFVAMTDDSWNSNWFIDDVSFQSSFYTYLPLVLKDYCSYRYEDDFSDPNSGWASEDDEFWTFGYINGEYQIRLKDAWTNSLMTPDLILPSDYSIEVDARQVSANVSGYGLVFGLRHDASSWEGYQIIVDTSSQEYVLEKKAPDDTWTTLIDWPYTPQIKPGTQTNHIRVDRIGTKIDVYINGTKVGSVTDASFTGPGCDAGLRAYSYDDVPTDVRFDNFSATCR